jgi:hypothetical protein
MSKNLDIKICKIKDFGRDVMGNERLAWFLPSRRTITTNSLALTSKPQTAGLCRSLSWD